VSEKTSKTPERKPLGPTPGPFQLLARHGFAAALVPLPPRQKACKRSGWPTWRGTPKDFVRLDAQGRNVGLRTEDFPAVDVDVDDEVLAGLVRKVLRAALPNAQRRFRQDSPRFALLTRRDGPPFRKRTLAFKKGGAAGKVEVLAKGQYILAAGVHPDGAKLCWADGNGGGPLYEGPNAETLPGLSEKDADRLLDVLQEKLEAAGCEVSRPVGPKKEKEGAPPKPAEPPEPDRAGEVADALSHLDPDMPYDEWVRVGMSAKSGLGSKVGFPVWDAWSATGKKYPGRDACAAKWATFRRSGVELGTIIKAAVEAGWKTWNSPERPEDVFKPEPVVESPPAEGGASAEADDRPDIAPASSFATRRLDWLWRGRLALGQVSIFAGNPGEGKSIITLDLAARLSRGKPLPGDKTRPGDEKRGPVDSLILNAEDGKEDTIRPRLEAADADLDRVWFEDASRRSLTFPQDMEHLERILDAHPEVRFLVIDPLNEFLSVKVDSWKDQHVRRALRPLRDLAQRRRLCVALVLHWNKTGGDGLGRMQGSVGHGGLARSVLYVGKHAESGERIVAQQKRTTGRDSPALAFEVAGSVPRDEDSAGVVHWLGEREEVNARDLTRPPEQRSKVEDARRWLEAFLSKGPRPSADAFRDGKAAGYGRDILYRAAKALGARVSKEGQRGEWVWELPADVREEFQEAADLM
jgi:hypothetical protein